MRAPENQWLEDDHFPFVAFGLFSGATYVSFMEDFTKIPKPNRFYISQLLHVWNIYLHVPSI